MISTTRRQFLRLIGLGAASTLVAACTSAAPAAPTAAPAKPTEAAKPSGAAPAATTAPAATAAPAAAAKPAEAAKPAAPAATTAPAAAASKPSSGGVLNFAMDTEPDVLDPNYSPQRPSQIVFFSIFDCLVARDKDNTFKPWLATSWQVSPDGKTYTFKLRNDVKFHDGTPLNAQAIKFNYDRMFDEKFASRMIGSGGGAGFYQSSEVVDDQTVKINLKSSWAPFLDAASYLHRIVSPAGVQKYGADFGRNPVGSGPYKFVEWVASDHVTVERNPDYKWPGIYKNQGAPLLDKIVFKVIPEAGTRTAVLEKGEADVAMTLTAQDCERLQADPKYALLVGRTPGVPFLFAINVTKAPTDELAVRQAINYGVDREAIVNIVYGPFQTIKADTAAYGPLVPGTYGYDKSVEIYKNDAEKAKQLLDAAGWKPGSGGVRMKDGKPLQVILGTWETQSVADVAQAQLKDIGMDVQVQISPPLTVNENQRKGDSHMSPLPAARSDPSILSNMAHSRNMGGFNFTFAQDPKLDDLFDKADAEVDDKKRLELVTQVQKILMDQAMVFPLYNRDNIVVASKKVDGLEFERGFFPWIHDVSIKG
jgi:peptide/nickel transport system substrate-binding protein